MKNEKVKAIILGVGAAAGTFLVICLGRSLIRGTSFAEQVGRAFNWFLAGLGGCGTAVGYLRKKADK